MHGHNYTVRVEAFAVDLDNVGFVMDYRDLDIVKEYLDAKFDHRCLNDQMDVNPTAENLAKWVHGFIVQSALGPRLANPHGGYRLSVGVSETAKTWATYTE
jgi:6-pyruvoyltetrahydropterin/6-carboxytetrahydropterin synthase